MENYRLKRRYKNLKVYIKIEKTIVKFGGIEIEKPKFYEYKRPISIKNIDLNKIVVSFKASFSKKGFKYFIGYEDAKKIDLYAYFFQKCMHIEETLMKLNIYLFW